MHVMHVICLYTTWLFIIDKTFSMKIILLFFFLGDKTMGLRKMALAHTSGAAGFVSREGSYGRNRRQNCSIRQKSQKTVRYQVRIHTIHSYLSHIIARTSLNTRKIYYCYKELSTSFFVCKIQWEYFYHLKTYDIRWKG